MDGSEALRKWLETAGVSLAACAEAVGVSAPAVQAWKSGKYRPEVVERMKLERFTAGAVPANAWITPPEAAEISAVQPLAAETRAAS